MAQRDKGTMGNFSVIGTVDGIELVEGKTYSYVLFHTKTKERANIQHRMFTGSRNIGELTAGDLVEFYCRLTANPYQDKVYYNPEVKAFHIIKKVEGKSTRKEYVEVEDKSGQDDIPF